MATEHSQERGFTLVELLIVVAIIGVIVAIAVPALLSAINRARQSSTMAEIRIAGQALQMYQSDFAYYPSSAGNTLSDIEEYLVPTYIGALNTMDGWDREIQFFAGRLDYTIVSFGANGEADAPYSQRTTNDITADIVYSNGSFFQWPSGVQN